MKLLDQVRQVARVKHFSYRTEQAYVYWAERFIRFLGIRHPVIMGAPEGEQFLTHLAVHDNVAASAQNQAVLAVRPLPNPSVEASRMATLLSRSTVCLRPRRGRFPSIRITAPPAAPWRPGHAFPSAPPARG